MKPFILTFLLGICSIYVISYINIFSIVIPLGIALISFVCFKKYKLIKLILSGFFFGVFWINLNFYHQIKEEVSPAIENKPIIIQGKIDALPDKKLNETTFLFKTKDQKLALAWYQSVPILHVGEEWQLNVKLKKPHGFENPGGFDYKKWLISENIQGTGEIISGKNNQLIAYQHHFFSVNQIREYLLEKMQMSLAGQPLSEMIFALTIGDRNDMSSDEWLVLQRTGTAHLMAIAGLHIGLISGMIFFLIDFLWRRSTFLCLRIPSKIAAGISSLIIALIYSALAGFALPTERALIMLAVILFGMILRRPLVVWHSVLMAILVILILNPLSILSDAFWLSFCAISSITYALSGRLGVRNKWKELGKLQWVVAAGVFPLTLMIFNQGAWLSPLLNAIAIPWVGLIVLPLSLLACAVVFFSPSLAHLLWLVALKNLQWVWIVLSFFSHQSWVSWQPNLSSIDLFFSSIAIFLLLSPKGFPGRYLGFFLFLPLLFVIHDKVPEGNVKFTLLDVGQGLASVVETAHHVLIFDTGPKFSPIFDAGIAVILPFLHYYGINHVDKIIISHGDNDHIGGVWSLIKNISIQEISTSVPERFDQIKSIKITACQRGDEWIWDQVDFQILYPPVHELACGNNCSCVLKITAGQRSILLTGDIEKPAENYLVSNEKSFLTSSVLVAPHHGSKTSSTPDFIAAVNPKFVFFPVGYLNRFHFPSSIILQRYQSLHIPAFSTAEEGAITVMLDGKSIRPEGYMDGKLY
jgi:competence protein ComEC